MSVALLVSPGVRFDAWEVNATYRPSLLIAGCWLSPLAERPTEVLIRRVVPVCRSRMKMSVAWLVSPGVRLVACDRNATYRPFGVMAALELPPLARAPVLETLIRRGVPAGGAPGEAAVGGVGS